MRAAGRPSTLWSWRPLDSIGQSGFNPGADGGYDEDFLRRFNRCSDAKRSYAQRRARLTAKEVARTEKSRPASLEVVVPKEADELEQFAAAELHRYLERLFGVAVRIESSPSGTADSVLVLGTSGHISISCLGETPMPHLSDQGFLLRKTTCLKKPAMAIVGGSPAALLWGVYELVERYGVTYLLGGDVYPEKRQAFYVPEINQVFEPTFKARWFKTMGDFAMGMEGWGWPTTARSSTSLPS